MTIFIPDEHPTIDVPYLEDARADYAPYYDNRREIRTIEGEVLAELAKLGAGGFVVPGKAMIDGQWRHGYELRFTYMGGRGVIRVFGLPVKLDETPRKIEQVRKQALLNLRDWLKTSVTQQVFGDRGAVLVPYMLIPGTDQTVYEAIVQTGGVMPALPPGVRVEEG